MAFLSSLKQIVGSESSSIAQKFMPEFFKLVLGTLSLPINLPNTNYRRGFQVLGPKICVALYRSTFHYRFQYAQFPRIYHRQGILLLIC